MFLFSCLLFWSFVAVPVCVMLSFPSCLHAIGSLDQCVMFWLVVLVMCLVSSLVCSCHATLIVCHKFVVPLSGSTKPLDLHKLAYRDHQKAYSKSIKEARSQYYSNIIQNSYFNSKKLFSTINHLLKPQVAPLTGATEEQCNNFMKFF